MVTGQYAMNDFRFGIYSYDNNTVTYLTPEHYSEYFDKSIQMMDKVLSDNESSDSIKPVIVLTHHCPSKLFLSKKFEKSMYNASYISNLEYFMEKHPSIKLWLSGHIHNRIFKEYVRQDGSVVKVVANPRGYVHRFEAEKWTENVFVDTDTWEVYKTGAKQKKITLL
jgi:Icc-related predicted phosphoesterase